MCVENNIVICQLYFSSKVIAKFLVHAKKKVCANYISRYKEFSHEKSRNSESSYGNSDIKEIIFSSSSQGHLDEAILLELGSEAKVEC